MEITTKSSKEKSAKLDAASPSPKGPPSKRKGEVKRRKKPPKLDASLFTIGRHDIERRPTKDEKVSFRMTAELAEALNDLQKMTSARGPSDVLRQALLVFHTLVLEKKRGHEPMVMSSDSDFKEGYSIFGD